MKVRRCNMCGLFGFSCYGENQIKDLTGLTNSLAEQSAVRGTDATGIAFVQGKGITIQKDSKSAYKLLLKHPDNITALIGHTRHSTQGSEKRNYNNHPFSGKTENCRFALAHNGVLINDDELRKKLRLPKTKIETDSYIAVQLIESKKKLNMDTLKYMAETVEGGFSFSVLDDKNNLYLIKGDSPLSILHFPKLKIYVYASTDEILYKALVDYSPLFSALKKGEFEAVDISEGDILKIKPDGNIEQAKFNYNCYTGRSWWSFGSVATNDYIEDLKSVAAYQGYSPEDVDELLSYGWFPEEIEDYIYSCGCEV